MADGVDEDLQAGADGGQRILAGPGGVLEGLDVALRVGHEAEDEAGGIADAGDVVHRSIGIFISIDQGDLLLVVIQSSGVSSSAVLPVRQ